MKRRLLLIGHVWPEPRSSAAGQRSLSLLREFSRAGWHVTFASAAERSERSEGLEDVTDETVSIALNDDGFDAFARHCRPDAVIFDRFMVEEQFGWRIETHCPRTLRILDTVDLHCLRRMRRTPHAGNLHPLDALLSSDDAKREIASIFRCDLSLVISRYEFDLLVQRFSLSETLLHHLPFMYESSLLRRSAPAFSERQDFVTIGNFLHTPNLDSVEWLHEEIWPLLRRRLPEAQLHVYGAYTPDRILRLDSSESGFRVHGWSPDAQSVLGRARVCLAPLRYGAGLKGKIADAMLAGTPVVTTAIGAESMGLNGRTPSNDDWCGYIAETPSSLAAGGAMLYETQHVWQRAQQRGLDIATASFDADTLGPSLIDRVEDCIDRLEPRRLANFTGAMLRHHQHRSTEYMARWIEAKNRLRK